MAGLMVAVNSGECSLVANTAKSLLQIKAPANQRLLIKALGFYGKQSAGGTDQPVRFRMTRSTANFGTFGAANTGKDPSAAETPQGTYGANASVEPTSPAETGKWWELQPQTDIILPLAPGQEILVPGGDSVQFEALSNGTPVLMVQADVEE